MKESISPQECRLLAAIMFAGFCANSRYCHSPVCHIQDTLDLLDRLLTALDGSREVK